VRDLASTELLVAFVVLGYVVGLPALVLTIGDGRTISRRVWAALGRRRLRWEQQQYLGYALGGWPALVMAWWWRTGRLRHELRRERTLERERGQY
jgi:hypothetical protein